MLVRSYKNTMLVVTVGAVALTVHLGLGVAVVDAARRWLGWVATGVLVAVVVLVHVSGFRRLAARKRARGAQRVLRLGDDGSALPAGRPVSAGRVVR